MRALAEKVVDESPTGPIPDDLLWPYYQDALLKKVNGPLTMELKETAEKVWKRDQDRSKKFYTSFFW